MIDNVSLYLDTEFNGFNGDLISLAFAYFDSNKKLKTWYRVLEYHHLDLDPWVARNVIPVLKEYPQPRDRVQKELQEFLNSFGSPVTVVADWPEDINLLCKLMITGPGRMINLHYPVHFRLDTSLPNTASLSRDPHNAAEDAVALCLYDSANR